jgi:PhnB protein
MELQPYLFFDGRCEEAIDFYRTALGAKVTMMMRFKESPEPPNKEMCPGASPEKIMHASLDIGGAVLMASDGRCAGQPDFRGFSLSLTAPSVAEGEKLMKALGDGGQVTMPFGKTFWAQGFGMVQDRFGVGWMINVMG